VRTQQERLLLLHRRAAQLKEQSERKCRMLFGSASVCLFALLVWFTAGLTALPAPVSGGDYAAASLLGENTGGYVLAAVIAFMAGVIITAAILKKRRKK